LGNLSAIIGGCFFLYLLFKTRAKSGLQPEQAR
jgi:hypothetical protein